MLANAGCLDPDVDALRAQAIRRLKLPDRFRSRMCASADAMVPSRIETARSTSFAIGGVCRRMLCTWREWFLEMNPRNPNLGSALATSGVCAVMFPTPPKFIPAETTRSRKRRLRRDALKSGKRANSCQSAIFACSQSTKLVDTRPEFGISTTPTAAPARRRWAPARSTTVGAYASG